MKRKRFTEEQIIGILKEAEAGAKSLDLCRWHGISEPTFYRWKAKCAGLEVNEAGDCAASSTRIPGSSAWSRTSPWITTR